MESELYNWVVEKRKDGCCISGHTIQKEAIKIYESIHPLIVPPNFISKCELPYVEFKASRGWLYNFIKRKDFILRRVSSHGRDLPSNVISHIKNFFQKV